MAVIPISAEAEYNKNPKIKKEDIKIMLDWINNEQNLPKIREQEVIAFYHSCFEDIESTKKKIIFHFKMRADWKGVFGNYDPKNRDSVVAMNLGLYILLPGFTKEGYKVIYARILDLDVAKFSIDLSSRILIMMMEIDLLENGTHPGIILVIDMEGTRLAHSKKINFSTMKNVVSFTQDACPVRLKGIYFINLMSFVHNLLSLVKPLMKKSYKESIRLYPSSSDTIFETVPKEIFPKEISGNGLTFEEMRVNAYNRLMENRDFLLERMKIVADLPKK